MRVTTDALIIRENNNIGESDRFVTALTRELGLVRASARGARNLKNRSASATQLLSYSRLSLYKGREKYIIDEAEPLQVFFELRADIERLALAQYFCELAGVIAPSEEPAEEYLRLLLNALHLLGSGQRDPRLVKAVVELRLLALAGYMPDLTACRACGAQGDAVMWLSLTAGDLTCGKCAAGSAASLPRAAFALAPGTLAAMRHVLYAPPEKGFSFTLSEEGMGELSRAAEAFLLAQLQRGFRTLEFYHSVAG
jgi:DNA repair protein recO